VAFPLGALLARHFGWQGALLVLALVQVLLTCPANGFGAHALQRAVPPRGSRDASAVEPGRLRRMMRGAAFWQLAGILGLIWLNHAVLTNFALPVLMNRGASHDLAVGLAALAGPAQIAGRLVLVLAGERMSLRPVTLVTLGGFILSSWALVVGVGDPALWMVYALVQGAAAGVATILRPLLAAEVFGHADFGSIWGALSVAPLLAGAAAPVLGAFLLQWGGAGLLIGACLSMAVVALALGVLLSRGMARA
jgi:predicted MFS family arabinose efflux permease